MRNYLQNIMSNYSRILHDSRSWLRLAFQAFIAGIIIGVLSGVFHVQAVFDFLQTMLQDLSDLGTEAGTIGIVQRIFLIWQNNLVAVMVMIFGGFLLGYIPFASLFANGLILGLVSVMAVQQKENIGLLLLSIVPHGIIELPVLIWAGAAGMKLGLKWLRPESKGKRKKVLNDTVLEGVTVMAACVVLLLVAAAIEGGLVFELLK